MTTETTSATNDAGVPPLSPKANQSADFLSQLPIELELANPWTISDDELREIAGRATSMMDKAYIAGVLAGRVWGGPVRTTVEPQEDLIEQALVAMARAEKLLADEEELVRGAFCSSTDRNTAEGKAFRWHRAASARHSLYLARLALEDVDTAFPFYPD